MRMASDSPVHVTYCTNVHGGESWAETLQKLKQYLPAVKKQVCPDASFGVGLRLSALAARELRREGQLEEFKNWLYENGLYVFTLNGFPYGRFHGVPVKDSVYAPDWRDEARTSYTLDLIDLLSHLLPEKVAGSISTLPASYKPWFHDERRVIQAHEQSAENLAFIVMHLRELEQATGKLIRLGLEPEPDGLVEDTDEFITYFHRFLIPAVKRKAERHQLNASMAEEIAYRYLGICFDTCHASVQYEQPHEALTKLASSGIAVTKVQVSSALRFTWRSGPHKQQLKHLLQELNDPVYLHQVRERGPDGHIHRFTDLPEALRESEATDGAEWRIHFHVPVFLEKYGLLSSTHSETAECVRLCLDKEWCEHFEIETYTWDVLPPELRTSLVHSITQEFDWTVNQMSPNHFTEKCEEQRSSM
jgi:hypothetical protein